MVTGTWEVGNTEDEGRAPELGFLVRLNTAHFWETLRASEVGDESLSNWAQGQLCQQTAG
jgi:hypothetical protein